MTYPPTIPLNTPPPRRALSTGAIVAIVVGAVVALVCGLCVVGGIVNGVIGGRGTAPNAEATKDGPPKIDAVQPPSAIPVTVASPDTARTTTAPAAMIVVPSGVGLDYQSAQDLWRAAGLHVAPAIDATGAHRLPVLDSNWVVLAQDPLANTTVDTGTFITATVKKYTDS